MEIDSVDQAGMLRFMRILLIVLSHTLNLSDIATTVTNQVTQINNLVSEW